MEIDNNNGTTNTQSRDNLDKIFYVIWDLSESDKQLDHGGRHYTNKICRTKHINQAI